MLDEPTKGLDPAGIRELRGHRRQFAQDQNVAVFLSSHALNEVEQVTDWIGCTALFTKQAPEKIPSRHRARPCRARGYALSRGDVQG